MGRYRLVLRRSIAKDLRNLPNKDVARILECFKSLAEEPRAPGCEKLSNQEKYRFRVGVYRIIYEIVDDILVVIVVKVAHRRDVYKSG